MSGGAERRPTFRIVGDEVVFRGFATLSFAEIERRAPDGGVTRFRRLVEDHGTAAAVLAYDPVRREAVLVRQFRPPVALSGAEGHVLEAIAGLIDKDGEDAAATARREAEEEAGLRLGVLTALPPVYSMPGISRERMHLFLAEVDLSRDRIGAGGGADGENEDIEVVILPLRELAAMLVDGRLDDMKTVLLVQALLLRRAELFG